MIRSYPTFFYLFQLHDIAVLRLTEPILFTDYIRPICLDDGSPRVDTGYVEGVVAGYGKLKHSNRPVTDVLFKVNDRIQSPAECQNVYSPYGVTLRDTHICAGTPTGIQNLSFYPHKIILLR